MSTNFYLHRDNRCKSCGHTQGDDVHIGKRFGAGDGDCSFTFRAHDGTDGQVKEVASVADWRAVIPSMEADGWIIMDEYGKIYTSTEFFAEEVDSIPVHKRGLQYRMVLNRWSRYSGSDDATDYLDQDGYSFSKYEFS